MVKTLQAIFDGEVLRPEYPVNLELNQLYMLTIEPVRKSKEIDESQNDPAFNLSSLAVKTNIPDLATEHDYYLYGTPKRGTIDGT